MYDLESFISCYETAHNHYRNTLALNNTAFSQIAAILGITRQAVDYYHQGRPIKKQLHWKPEDHIAGQVYLNVSIKLVEWLAANNLTNKTGKTRISLEEAIMCLKGLLEQLPAELKNYKQTIESAILNLTVKRLKYVNSEDYKNKWALLVKTLGKGSIMPLPQRLNAIIDYGILPLKTLAQIIGTTTFSLRYRLRTTCLQDFNESEVVLIRAFIDFFSINLDLLIKAPEFVLSRTDIAKRLAETEKRAWEQGADGGVYLAYNITRIFK
jgi:hypothetical protein